MTRVTLEGVNADAASALFWRRACTNLLLQRSDDLDTIQLLNPTAAAHLTRGDDLQGAGGTIEWRAVHSVRDQERSIIKFRKRKHCHEAVLTLRMVPLSDTTIYEME